MRAARALSSWHRWRWGIGGLAGGVSLPLTILAGVLGAVAFVAVLAFPRVEAFTIARALEQANATLRLVAVAVDQTVARHRPLPALIAGDPDLASVLRQSNNAGVVPFVNQKLRLIAQAISAKAVYVLDTQGRAVATSSYRDPDSNLGKSSAFRPYFQRAIEGKAAVFHALSTQSGDRTFYFAAPILDGIEVVGVLAVTATVAALEAEWTGLGRDILVADANGVAFLSSRADYRLRSLAPMTDAALAQIAAAQQFPPQAMAPLPLSASVIRPGAVEVTLGAGQAAFLATSQPIGLPGWHAIVLTPVQGARAQALTIVLAWALVASVIALGMTVLLQRRAQLRERIQIAQTHAASLEAMVQARTADLDAANASLRSEVVERRGAETRLKRTQKELIQAGKLAALGQMSAALSHEINQPLTAIKSYAVNAAEYLQRDRVREAGDNITRISEMADRMAEISRHLRNFARRPGDTLKPVGITGVIDAALALAEPQIRRCEARVEFTPPPADILVLGGELRLQQVVVNILTNALDAMRDASTRVVEIGFAPSDTELDVTFRDHGHGLPPESLDQVFEAFYTTKDPGAGMGLGMSISYNIVKDFGGTLRADNHPDGGAVFTLSLRRATP